jgi:hypothetical protein
VSAGAPLLGWLALGIPAGLVFWRHGRADLAAGVLPFAGALAVLLPVAAAPWLGGDLSSWPWQTPLAALLLGAACHGMLRGAPGPASGSEAGSLPQRLAALALLAGALSYPLVVGAELARGWPGYGWDGQVIWLVRTRVLAESAAFPAPLFAEPLLAQGHWDYPLLFPALLAWFVRIGDLELRQLPVALGLMASVFPLASAVGLARMLRPPLAAAVALLPFSVPELARFHFQAYADPLLVFTALTGLAWTSLGALRGDRAAGIAGGLALAAAVSIKNEGVLWLAASCAGAALLSLRRSPSWREWAAELLPVAAPGLLIFAVWRTTCRLLGAPGDLASQLRYDLVGERLLPLGLAFGRHVLTPANLPLLCGALLALWLWLPGDARSRLRWGSRLLAAPGLLAAGLFAVYLGTPHDLRWHVLTSLHRTVYGIVPALGVAAACATTLRQDAAR